MLRNMNTGTGAAQNLTTHEMRSIQSLIAYVAYTNHVGVDSIESMLRERFEIDDVGGLERDHFDPAIEMLTSMDR